jgi:hypothetical protein
MNNEISKPMKIKAFLGVESKLYPELTELNDYDILSNKNPKSKPVAVPDDPNRIIQSSIYSTIYTEFLNSQQFQDVSRPVGIDLTFNNMLATFNLKKVEAPNNFFSLINSIKLYFYLYKPLEVEQTMNELYSEFCDYINQLPYLSIDLVYSYFCDQEFTDTNMTFILMLAANVFGIDLFVFDKTIKKENNNVELLVLYKVTPIISKFKTDYIVLVVDDNKFNLILPNNHDPKLDINEIIMNNTMPGASNLTNSQQINNILPVQNQVLRSNLYQPALTNYFNSLIGTNRKQYGNTLEMFLFEHNLKKINVPGNGLCFINTIRLYFHLMINRTYSVEEIHTLYYHYFDDPLNLASLTQFDTDTTVYNETTVPMYLASYFLNGNFDNEFTDISISVAFQIFNISIVIIHRNVNTQINNGGIYWYEHIPTVNNHRDHYIFVLHDGNHYNLLLPKYYQVNAEIDFNNSIYEKQDIVTKIKYESNVKEIVEVINKTKKKGRKRGRKKALTTQEQRKRKRLYNQNKTVNKSTAFIKKNTNGKQYRKAFNETGLAINESHPRYKYFHVGKMNAQCAKCGAYNFEGERVDKGHFSICCKNGKVKLGPAMPVEKELQDLYLGTGTATVEQSQHFLENIRTYNNLFSMVSFAANLVQPPGGNNPATTFLKIHGQIRHRASTLEPNLGASPQFGQLYILDTNSAVNERENNPIAVNCRKDIIEKLTKIMDQNPLVTAYKTMKQRIDEEKLLFDARYKNKSKAPDFISELRMYINRKLQPGQNKHVYNDPTVDGEVNINKNDGQIACVFMGKNDVPVRRKLIVYPKHSPNNEIKILDFTHEDVDPMCYPLIFSGLSRGNFKKSSFLI